METKAAIGQLLNNHLQKHPSDEELLNAFFTFIKTTGDNNLFSRKNLVGHITASAFIINADADKLLLLKHKALNRWLQPGGHVDTTDTSLLSAALREAQEETGIPPQNLQPVQNAPLDFDSHFIPENTQKQEPSHFHHDIRFLFNCVAGENISIAEEESTAGKWIRFSDISDRSEFKKVVDRILQILKNKSSAPSPV